MNNIQQAENMMWIHTTNVYLDLIIRVLIIIFLVLASTAIIKRFFKK